MTVITTDGLCAAFTPFEVCEANYSQTLRKCNENTISIKVVQK